MQKVLVFSQIDPQVLVQLKQDYQVLQVNPKLGAVDQQIIDYVADADGMIGAGRRIDAQHLAAATQLKVISSVSVGYDNYDVDYLRQRQIMLCHTPHVLTETTADLAWSLILGAARQVAYLDRWTKQGHWQRTVSPAQFGQDIFAQTLGIIGLGNIGQAIARRGFHGFNMQILYHTRREKPEVAQALNAKYCDLDTLLQRSDVVVLAVDLNADSQALIGAAQLAQMAKHAILVNISRGAVLDEQALYQALQHGQIFAAGLDVYQHEPLTESALFELDRVLTLPHIGSATARTRQRMAQLAYRQLHDALQGRQPSYLV